MSQVREILETPEVVSSDEHGAFLVRDYIQKTFHREALEHEVALGLGIVGRQGATWSATVRDQLFHAINRTPLRDRVGAGEKKIILALAAEVLHRAPDDDEFRRASEQLNRDGWTEGQPPIPDTPDGLSPSTRTRVSRVLAGLPANPEAPPEPVVVPLEVQVAKLRAMLDALLAAKK